jgi:hypothetical protein
MVRSHGSQSPASCESTLERCDAPVSFEQPATCERADGAIPEAIVKGFAADICAQAGR